MPALLLVAVALGLSNCAAAVGIGVLGADARTRLRTGLVFGLFEAGMPLLGLLAGHGVARALGHAAQPIGAAVLIGCGAYAVLQATRRRGAAHGSPGPATTGTMRLLASGLALSLDNLAVGFALGTYHVNLLLAVLVIGAVSVALSLAGLELGARLGARIGGYGELASGLVLIAVGAALAAGLT